MALLVNVAKLASLLVNDSTLALEWEYLYHSLELAPSKKNSLKAAYDNCPDGYSLLYAIVEQWTVEKMAKATTQNLAAALLAARRVDISGWSITRGRFMRIQVQPLIFLEKVTRTFGQNVIPRPANILGYANIRGGPAENEYVDLELQNKTLPSGISIFQLASNQPEGQGRLLIFVSYLLKLLSKVGNNPVSIVSINGKQRSGKSFLATQFIKYLKFEENWLGQEMGRSFTWRNDFDRVTSGIQIWHETLQVKRNGKTIHVIVMDTQGLHDSQTGTQENAAIFGLSALLSSVFIYNEKHAGDDSLQFLRSFLEHAKFAAAGAENSEQNQMRFQKLVVLLRDFESENQFPFGYYDDSSAMEASKNLKKKFFDISSQMHPQAVETRRGIQNCFEHVAVYAMAGPGSRRPHATEYKDPASWENNFRASILDFVPKIFSPENISSSTKKIFGNEISGTDLIPFVSKWADLIQKADGAVESKTVFESTAELFYNGKMEKLSAKYDASMNQFIQQNQAGVDQARFNNNHNKLVQQLKDEFSSGNVFGGEQIMEIYKTKFLAKVGEQKKAFEQINQANIKKEVERKRREEERIAAQKREAELQRKREAEAKAAAEKEAALKKKMEEDKKEALRKQKELERQKREQQLEAERKLADEQRQAAEAARAHQAQMEQLQRDLEATRLRNLQLQNQYDSDSSDDCVIM